MNNEEHEDHEDHKEEESDPNNLHPTADIGRASIE